MDCAFWSVQHKDLQLLQVLLASAALIRDTTDIRNFEISIHETDVKKTKGWDSPNSILTFLIFF